jgi:hypothetical protein
VKEGIEEIEQEYLGKLALQNLDFSYTFFHEPETYFRQIHKDEAIVISEFIEEEKKFLERTSKEQFDLVLKAFETLEGVHVVVNNHAKQIKSFFQVYTFSKYAQELQVNFDKIVAEFTDLEYDLEAFAKIFLSGEERVKQYCGFLTHFDFVPHNFRVSGDKIYLLDHSSLRIGNKHEGWARLINFMSLYNRELEVGVIKYFELNRSKEEIESLKLMRIFRLFELLAHHTKIYKESADSLKELSKKRVYFWFELLKAVIDDRLLDGEVVMNYKNSRDSLRSDDEKERQKVLY